MAELDSGGDREQIDIAVVGAGVAGTYCCWRLQTAQTGRKAVLFEMSGRIGGRLLSVEMPGIPGVIGELGGMRFLSLQRMVVSLTKYLALPTSDFPMGGPLNISTLRGTRLRNAVFEYPQIVPYRMLPGEQGLGPGDLLVKAIKTVIPNATSLTPQEWEYVKQTAKWNDDYLYNWGLWNVLLSKTGVAAGDPPVLSSEAYALLYDGGGYESLVDNWNCAEAFEYLLIDFPQDAQYLRLTKGYQTLPETLARQFTDAGGKIYMKHQLTTFVPKRVNGATVIDLDVLDEPNNVMRRYRAAALVLAMPQRSLDILAQDTPTLDSPEVRTLLKSVMPMPAYKALAVYERPWWKKALGINAGRSTTDLPIRQVYYMDSGKNPNTNSLMLATYADGRTQSFWDGLYKGRKFELKFPITRNKFFPPVGAASLTELDQYLAPDAFGRTLHALTAEMHQLTPDHIPWPNVVYAKDWSEDPYGGGWHFWRPGVKIWETLPRVRQPVDAVPLHICGESYTNQQGWVEGALTSAEHVMQKYFKLQTPSWLDPQSYFIGP
jgi:lysine 2-monooxygenase